MTEGKEMPHTAEQREERWQTSGETRKSEPAQQHSRTLRGNPTQNSIPSKNTFQKQGQNQNSVRYTSQKLPLVHLHTEDAEGAPQAEGR